MTRILFRGRVRETARTLAACTAAEIRTPRKHSPRLPRLGARRPRRCARSGREAKLTSWVVYGRFCKRPKRRGHRMRVMSTSPTGPMNPEKACYVTALCSARYAMLRRYGRSRKVKAAAASRRFSLHRCNGYAFLSLPRERNTLRGSVTSAAAALAERRERKMPESNVNALTQAEAKGCWCPFCAGIRSQRLRRCSGGYQSSAPL
jgi:hypothetical protein